MKTNKKGETHPEEEPRLSHNALRLYYIIVESVTSSVGFSLERVMAATFRDVKHCKADVLKDSVPLLYIHCVSENDFHVSLTGIKCVELVCRQVHVSFVDKNERKTSGIVVGGEKSDVLFDITLEVRR